MEDNTSIGILELEAVHKVRHVFRGGGANNVRECVMVGEGFVFLDITSLAVAACK